MLLAETDLAISSDTEPAKYDADGKSSVLGFLYLAITGMLNVDSLNFGYKARENCSLIKQTYINHVRVANNLSGPTSRGPIIGGPCITIREAPKIIS
jgi:hypothetical protein